MKNEIKNGNPLVSVIMPAYNSEKYIDEAIDSILVQTYREMELLVIDDGSSDSTWSELLKYNDKRIRPIKNNRNKGIAYTTNLGISESGGKYIALMDDDDIAFPERIALQVEYMESHPEIDILGGRSVDIDGNGNVISEFAVPHYNPKYIKAMLLIQCVDFRNGTAMIKKDFLNRTGLKYKDEYLGMQDYRFYMEASKNGKISTIPDFLLKWRLHGQNETVRQMNENSNNRAAKYREIQKDSLNLSGFRLEECEYDLLFNVYSERHTGCANYEEWEKICKITKKLVLQGKEMNIDYGYELEHYLKKRLCEQLMLVHY